MEGVVLHTFFMSTVLSKQRPLNQRVRRHNGVIQKRRYGKWYDQNQLDSLAAYKFNAFGNAQDLNHNKDYSEWDIHYVQPQFKWTDTRRGIVAPSGFFRYLMNTVDVGGITYEQATKLFVPQKIDYVSTNARCLTSESHGDLYNLKYDRWYPTPSSDVYDIKKYYKYLPFIIDGQYQSIIFTLRQGLFVKWDDDIEKKIGQIELEIDGDLVFLGESSDLMDHLVEPEII